MKNAIKNKEKKGEGNAVGKDTSNCGGRGGLSEEMTVVG